MGSYFIKPVLTTAQVIIQLRQQPSYLQLLPSSIYDTYLLDRYLLGVILTTPTTHLQGRITRKITLQDTETGSANGNPLIVAMKDDLLVSLSDAEQLSILYDYQFEFAKTVYPGQVQDWCYGRRLTVLTKYALCDAFDVEQYTTAITSKEWRYPTYNPRDHHIYLLHQTLPKLAVVNAQYKVVTYISLPLKCIQHLVIDYLGQIHICSYGAYPTSICNTQGRQLTTYGHHNVGSMLTQGTNVYHLRLDIVTVYHCETQQLLFTFSIMPVRFDARATLTHSGDFIVHNVARKQQVTNELYLYQ